MAAEAWLRQPPDSSLSGRGSAIDGVDDRLRRQRGVELAQRGAQAFHQHHHALGHAPQRSARADGFIHRRHRLPAENCKQANGGLLDELVFGVGVSHFVAKTDLRTGQNGLRTLIPLLDRHFGGSPVFVRKVLPSLGQMLGLKRASLAGVPFMDCLYGSSSG